MSHSTLPTEYTILITEGPRKQTFYTKPMPPLGKREVVIKTHFSGISHGTEMNVYRGLAPHFSNQFNRQTRLFVPSQPRPEEPLPERGYYVSADLQWKYPFAYGYANVGEVIACGEEVSEYKVGEYVYTYRQHTNYLVQPVEKVYRLPNLANLATGIFVSNANTALNGVMDSHIKLGDYVVIFGQGIVGLMVTQWARRAGAYKIITVDKIEARRKLSLQVGADLSLDPAEVDVALTLREMTEGRGADVTIEASGSYAALQEAVRTAAPNTIVTAMGFYSGNPAAINFGAEFHHNRVTIKGSLVDLTGTDLSATHSFARRVGFVCDTLTDLCLEPLISDIVPFHCAPDAYVKIDQHSDQLTQVILSY